MAYPEPHGGITRWLLGFVPSQVAVRWPERLRACAGALLGIALTGGATAFLLGSTSTIPMLVAPMGASTVLLFAAPASPLAQPWSIIGGNIVAAVVGVACTQWIASPLGAAALAVSLAIGLMSILRCLHPPSGAVALTAVLGGPSIHAMGYGFVLAPVALQSFALLGSALVYHAITGHRYPHGGVQHADPAISDDAPVAAGITHADVEAVLRRRTEWLDIDPGDLEALLRETEWQAYARTFSELNCGDIMSRRMRPVPATATLDGARRLLNGQGVAVLPVIDASRRVIGSVALEDLRQTRHGGWAAMLVAVLLRPWREAAVGISTVGQTATRADEHGTIDAGASIAELVPLFAQSDRQCVAVLDANRQLAGIITQADLIAGMYRHTRAPQRVAA